MDKYKAKEKEETDKKLLEGKKYQDLITNKEKELNDFKSKYTEENKARKMDKLESKFSRSLEKANAINAEDAMKFVKFDDLLDAENADDEIKKRVDDLIKNKSYLFTAKQQGTTRSTSENGQPSGNTGGQGQQGSQGTKIDPIVASLANKYKTT